MVEAISNNMDAIIAIVGGVVAIVHIWSKVVSERRENGKWDLEKTLQAVGATRNELKRLKEEGHIEGAKEIGDKAVELVEKYRGKKLDPKLANKAARSALADMNELHPEIDPKAE